MATNRCGRVRRNPDRVSLPAGNRRGRSRWSPTSTGPARPPFATVEIYLVGDDQSAQLAYEADAFDYTPIAVSAVRQLREALPAGAALIEAESTRYAWMTINMNAVPLQDIRVRQAIQYAYDSEAVLLVA